MCIVDIRHVELVTVQESRKTYVLDLFGAALTSAYARGHKICTFSASLVLMHCIHIQHRTIQIAA